MNKELIVILNDFIEITRRTDWVLGAWNFGSAMHGLTDQYSDADVVFSVKGGFFKNAEESLKRLLSGVCDEVILCWEEDFNSNAIINNGYLLEKNGKIFQFDIFLLNNDLIDDFMCKIHYTDLSEKDIIFDKDGSVRALTESCPHGEPWSGDIDRLIRTYLYHFSMTAKYLLRGDYFKLNHVMRILYDTHASLLLTKYDRKKWGGTESKLRFIPEDKKRHLTQYYCTMDFASDRERLVRCFEWFEEDSGGFGCINSAAVNEYWLKCTQNI